MKIDWHSRHLTGAHSKATWLVFVGACALFTGLVVVWFWNPEQRGVNPNQPLVVYCAAGIKPPVEAAARDYEKTYGVPVQLQYGGSMTLLANLQISQRGDLYLPADDSYITLAREKGLVAESIPLAQMQAVLAVSKGNPKNIRSLDDLMREGVSLGQANPDAAAIGKVTRTALLKSGRWDAVKARTLVFKPTVNEVANDLKLGAVDAGFIWDALVAQYPDVDSVPVPELKGAIGKITIGVLQRTKQPTQALRFARYLGARDRGLLVFAKWGYTPAAGDPWAVKPELHLLAGAMLRPAIEDTIKAFEQREGVKVLRVYNGCGILVAQMKSGERPDAYFSCDTSFMTQVHDLFLDTEDISQNQLVILVPKGNPQGIKELKDLGQPGLRVGLGHEQQSAMGALTEQMLKADGTYDAIRKNVKVETPTGDMLVNQLRTGSLDAVIAYLSNAKGAADKLETIPINIPSAIATQPVAIGREARYPQLTARLLDDIRSEASRQRFEARGFKWKLGEASQ